MRLRSVDSNPHLASQGFPRWLSAKASACRCRRPGFDPWIGKIPWRRTWQPTPVFLPGESHGQRGAWWATVHGVAKSRQDWVTKPPPLPVTVFRAAAVLVLRRHISPSSVLAGGWGPQAGPGPRTQAYCPFPLPVQLARQSVCGLRNLRNLTTCTLKGWPWSYLITELEGDLRCYGIYSSSLGEVFAQNTALWAPTQTCGSSVSQGVAQESAFPALTPPSWSDGEHLRSWAGILELNHLTPPSASISCTDLLFSLPDRDAWPVLFAYLQWQGAHSLS